MEDAKPQESTWLTMAREAYVESTSYVDTNYRDQWENNLRHFQSRHHSGSKYNTDAFKYRSKVFRPKTRSALRNNEAAAVAAFFANQDAVSIEPQNQNDQMQAGSADILKEVLNYRLGKTIPWFLTCIGGLQDAMVQGAVASYQYWEYREEEVDGPPETYLDDQGNLGTRPTKQMRPSIDEPCIELIPLENLRIHPGSKWTDPINSSPYVIRMVPMFVCDVKQRMRDVDPKTQQPKWTPLTDGEILSAVKNAYDTTRSTRDNPRRDPYEEAKSELLRDYTMVWCHENFMRKDGKTYVFWTLGTDYQLSEPKPIKEVYFTGDIPIVMGISVIEAHKLYPSGVGQLGEWTQKEINEVANQRLDNVKLVLNKRWLARRGSNVDLQSITRNVAGSVTLADNLDDVRAVEFNDVTASSYQEQDRLNVDFDELVGTFSASTIQTNRKMNETVGGMAMLRGGVNSLVEYVLRTFAETWVEPVLRQLVKLEQAYETDTVVLGLAAEKAQLLQKYGIDTITDELLNQELTVSVNVGMGATDPMTKMSNFGQAINMIGQFMATPAAMLLDPMEVSKEIFGRLGYKDGARFIQQQQGQSWQPGGTPDPEKQQMMQAIQQMQQQLAQMDQQLKDKSADRQARMAETQFNQENENKRFTAQLAADFRMKQMDINADMEQARMTNAQRSRQSAS